MGKLSLWLAAFLMILTACVKDNNGVLDTNSTGVVATNDTLSGAELKFVFTTINLSGYKYAPKHVFSVWVEDTSGKFINTIACFGKQRRGYLYKWNNTSGGFIDVDAVSGATQTKHTAHTVSWNMKTYRGLEVVNGDYNLCFEMTSKDGQGPVLKTPFTLDGNNFSLTPSNQSFIKTMSITYNNGK